MTQRFDWRVQNDIEDEQLHGDLTKVVNPEPSLTQQHFADDANLNTIVRRFGITDGAIPPAAADPSFYGDFSDGFDFKDALDSVRNATQRFDELPASIRQRFHNDPVLLYNWVTDRANADEAVKIGLLQQDQTIKQPTNLPGSTQTP